MIQDHFQQDREHELSREDELYQRLKSVLSSHWCEYQYDEDGDRRALIDVLSDGGDGTVMQGRQEIEILAARIVDCVFGVQK